MSSANLLAALARPDADSSHWAELVDIHGGRLWAVCCAAAGPLAEDAFQEGLIAIRQSAGRFRPGPDPEASAVAWMVTVVHRTAIDQVRSEARRRKHESSHVPHEPAANPPPASDDAGPVSAQDAMRALEQLPERHRQVIRLRLLGGLDAAQTASVLGCPPDQVRMRLHRALDLLRGRCAVSGAVMPSVAGLEHCLHQAAMPPASLPSAAKAIALASFTKPAASAGLSLGAIMAISSIGCAVVATLIVTVAMPMMAGTASEPSPAATTPAATAAPATAAMATAPTDTTARPVLTPGVWKDITPPQLYPDLTRSMQDSIAAKLPFTYGVMDMKINPHDPSTLYITTDEFGMWRSTNGGSTWTRIGNLTTPTWNHLTYLDSPGDMVINPRNPLQMYSVGGVRGSTQGFWVSNDGGETWSRPKGFTDNATDKVGGWTMDCYDVKADPGDFDHVLVTFHSGFERTGDAGVLESRDGGNTWIRHWPHLFGHGDSVWFLKDSKTWLVGSQASGYWRTADSGENWTQVSKEEMQHGGTDCFYSRTGVLYVGASHHILRSTDNGLTFTNVGPSIRDGFYAIVGDGSYLYTCLANTGGDTVGKTPYLISPETDGMTWTPYHGGAQTFSDGPYRMAFDPVNRIIYSSNWKAGVWALKVEDQSPVSTSP